MKITILGCGPSGGVPLVGGVWGNCDSRNPLNYRTRSSILIETSGHTLLVDTSPDMRSQLLRESVKNVDAVFFTHAHADHCHGIDDLRPLFYARKYRTIPIYGAQDTISSIESMFNYLFESRHHHYPQILHSNVLPLYSEVDLFGMKCLLFEQDHGFSKTIGYRFNNIAYSTDVRQLDDKALEHLQNLDLWIVDCLSENEKPTHAHLAQTLEWIAKVKPKQAILTHMDQSLDYEALKAKLPDNVEPAFDGMIIKIP